MAQNVSPDVPVVDVRHSAVLEVGTPCRCRSASSCEVRDVEGTHMHKPCIQPAWQDSLEPVDFVYATKDFSKVLGSPICFSMLQHLSREPPSAKPDPARTAETA